MSPDHGDDEGPQCRICFETLLKPSDAISPCKCKGTLQYVHPACLHRWQTNVLQMGGSDDERAYTCGVCRSRYTTSPPRPSPWRFLLSLAKALSRPACAGLLALVVCGSPLAHLALLVVLLIGTRSPAMICLLLLTASGLLGLLYTQGMRVILRTDGGGRLGMALIRYGAAIDGLQPGSLLVAHSDMDDPLFGSGVVLITEMSQRGTKGVLLTKPVNAGDVDHIQFGVSPDHPLTPHQQSAISHYMGGPSNPSTGATGWLALSEGLRSYGQLFLGGSSKTKSSGSSGGKNGSGGKSGSSGKKRGEVVLLHHVAGVEGVQQLLGPIPSEAEKPQSCSVNPAAGCTQQQEGASIGQAGGQELDLAAVSGWGSFVRGKLVGAAASIGAAVAAFLQQYQSSAPGADQQSKWGGQALQGIGLYQGGSLKELLSRLSSEDQQDMRPQCDGRMMITNGHDKGHVNPARVAASHLPGAAAEQPHACSPGPAPSATGSSGSASQLPSKQQVVSASLNMIRAYHGVCTWVAGQLEGEVRNGMWGFVERASVVDVIGTPPQQLWSSLMESGRLNWM